MRIEVLISFVDRDSSTGKLTSYAQGDVVSNLSDEVANAFISAGLAKAYTNLGVEGNISITANGQYDVADYAGATVNVPDFKNLVDGSITTVTADMLEGITKIDNYAFAWRLSLTSVTIPEGVKIIGINAFLSCNALTGIEIPATVIEIDDSAFAGCGSLASITVLATTPPILGSEAFDSSVEGFAIYVPAESVDTYKAASEWSSYASKIQAIPSD